MGTVFYHLSMDSLQAAQNRLGCFLLASAFLAFTGISSLPVSKPVHRFSHIYADSVVWGTSE